MKRYMAIWFRYLLTDGYTSQHPKLKELPFALITPHQGRFIICCANRPAEVRGVYTHKAVADARAVLPELQVAETPQGLAKELLDMLAEKCLEYTPDVATDMPDGLVLDISGCTHLWGDEAAYLKAIMRRLHHAGYHPQGAIADTIGAAWAISRYGATDASPLVPSGEQKKALRPLPAAALRLDPDMTARLHKLGLYTIDSFIDMPRSTLRKRFGQMLVTRIDQALGNLPEHIATVSPLIPYEEKLATATPIQTAKGIEIALHQLITRLCCRLSKEKKGIRAAVLYGHRTDHIKTQVRITTAYPSRNVTHLFKLFQLKIASLQPGLGIELFTLEATLTEELTAAQETLWETRKNDPELVAQLLDKIAGKIGDNKIHRYLPAAHHWPEHAYKKADSLLEKATTTWTTGRLRPLILLTRPERITVSVPLPDYPPLLFHYRGKLYRIIKADGPERIEQEWWQYSGAHRDYYTVEDETGARYWLFRSGHFNQAQAAWFLHGFFA